MIAPSFSIKGSFFLGRGEKGRAPFFGAEMAGSYDTVEPNLDIESNCNFYNFILISQKDILTSQI